MTFTEIRKVPDILDVRELPSESGRYHESVLRAFHVVYAARRLLLEGAPASVVVEVIDDLMGRVPPAGEGRVETMIGKGRV